MVGRVLKIEGTAYSIHGIVVGAGHGVLVVFFLFVLAILAVSRTGVSGLYFGS